MANQPFNTSSIRYPLPLSGFSPAAIAMLLVGLTPHRRAIVLDQIDRLSCLGFRLVWIDVLANSVDLEFLPDGVTEYHVSAVLLHTLAWPLLELDRPRFELARSNP
jgi:hypothetical protein